MSLLWRLARVQTGPDGTFGVLGLAEQPPRWVTLERPWASNQETISCVPDGQYDLVKVQTSHFGLAWSLDPVVGRTGILIHPANVVTELKGCIALAAAYGSLLDHPAILHSQQAVKEFYEAMVGLTTAKMDIRWAL